MDEVVRLTSGFDKLGLVSDAPTSGLEEARVPQPYALLDDWCGERFTVDVASRLSAMPKEQAADLLEVWDEWTRSATIPARQPGELRVFQGMLPVVGGELRPGPASDTLASLLLYAHRVVTSSLLRSGLEFVRDHGSSSRFGKISNPSSMLEHALRTLASYRELAEDGTILVVPHHSQPDRTPLLDEGQIQPDVTDMYWLQELKEEERDGTVEMLRMLARYDVGRQLLEAARCGTDLVFASRLSAQVFENSWAAALMPELPRARQTEQLLACVLPELRPTLEQIAAVRKGETVFATWRSQLTQGLLAVDALGDGHDWRREAHAVLAEHLKGPARELEKAVGKSAALSSLKSSSSTFTIAGIGAAAAEQVGGRPVPALVSAGVVGGAQLIRDYVEHARVSRGGKALLAHYYSLVGGNSP